ETAGGETLHVAGPGAMLGYLGIYMDRDARTLAPFAALLVLLSLFLAHRSAIGVIVPTLVIVGSVAVTLGTMALMGANFYVITNALPVILIGIAVDDALHIFGEYRRRLGVGSESDTKDRVVQTMLAMCRPVTVTTLTTAAGCLALGFSSSIPPMREFGLYAALGIGLAWVFSLTAVPAVMALWFGRLKPSTEVQPARGRSVALAEAATTGLKQLVFRRGRFVVVVSAVWLLVAMVAATSLRVDEANIDNFQEDEPIVVADSLINGHGIGSNYLDIMIEGSGEDALLRPEVLQYVDALQRYAESLLLVLQSVSYLDSLGQIDKALAEPGDEPNLVLGSEDRAAQYMLLYSMSGDPADLRTLVNNSYERANLRLYLGSGWFSEERTLIASLDDYLRANPAPEGIVVTLSGIAVVHVSWVGMLFEGHLGSILASLAVVWLIATISFRSPLRGSLVMVPVIFAVLTVYATMAFAGVNLGVGTSMTAAIAIGLSIDFGVHLLHRIDERCRVPQPVLQTAVGEAIQDSGRAIFFGFLTGFLGFGVLIMSEVPGVVRFGGLVALSLAASFLASLVLLPSLILTIKSLGARLLSTARGTLPPEHPNQRQAGNEICSSVKPSAS
ncbi:MAG: MMPL family transporter, partial [Cytophagales bacterium]|nr:MMPL family transporter [Cytophagales bacterium]